MGGVTLKLSTVPAEDFHKSPKVYYIAMTPKKIREPGHGDDSALFPTQLLL